MEIPTRRRRALSTALALFLALESVTAVAAVATITRGQDAGSRHPLPALAPSGVVMAERTDATDATGSGQDLDSSRLVSSVSTRRPEMPDSPRAGATRTMTSAAAQSPARRLRAAAPALHRNTAATTTKSSGTTGGTKSNGTSGGTKSNGTSGGTKTASSPNYRGTNHVWIPALGINRSVHSFPCDRKEPPNNYVYRWGCAGANNVYLLGHAYSVFKPLHDAYVSGRLRVGMRAYYADGAGRVHLYTVRWWKLTRPTTAASWAWAAQSVPSMTLQTCVGANSEYRLMVRLVEVN